MKPDYKRCTIIRIWLPDETIDYNDTLASVARSIETTEVGHVSIEIYQNGILDEGFTHYVSLWPVFELNPFSPKGIIVAAEGKMHSMTEDVRGEHDKPPFTSIALRSLDITKIVNYLEATAGKSRYYRLTGSNSLEGANNCSSLALNLLKEGGLEDLIDIRKYSAGILRGLNIISPKSLANLVNNAFLKEIEKYPEVKAFVLTDPYFSPNDYHFMMDAARRAEPNWKPREEQLPEAPKRDKKCTLL